MEKIKGLKQKIIMVTHDLDLIKDFERVLYFNKGRIVIDSDPITAINAYKDLYS